ncbi:MAG: TraB/GumN family protein, partial [Verrucomicrobia bacterium]|nr:TraB/GumN family protein [Verrucomicrobiota bacterium]
MNLPFRILAGFLPVLALAGALPADEAPMAPVWKISDADSTVFLAGSVHLLREKDLPLPSAFDRTYAECEELVFEIDMALMSRPETALEMHRLGSLPDGERLSDHFGPATMQRIRGYLKERKMSERFFDSYNPGMVYLLLSSLEAAHHGAKPELGLESTYYARCVTDGKPSRGLETVAYQISRLNGLEKEMVETIINEALDEVEDSGATLDSITAAWKSGDAGKLAGVIVDQSGFTPELREVLLTERNRNWIP